jgi:hypothetical protein
MTFEHLPPLAMLKLTAVMHENYASFDLAAVALEACDRVSGSQLHPSYVRALVRPEGR